MLESISDFVIQNPPWYSLGYVFAWMLVVIIICGTILASRPNWRDEIRAVSIFIAVLSILFFAFEQRADQLSDEAQAKVTQVLKKTNELKEKFTSLASNTCRQPSRDELFKLSASEFEEYQEGMRYCPFHQFIVGELSRIERWKLEDPSYQAPSLDNFNPRPNPAVPEHEAPITEASTQLTTLDIKLQELKIGNAENESLKKYFALAVVLFATGAAIDIGSETRNWFRPLARRFRKKSATKNDQSA